MCFLKIYPLKNSSCVCKTNVSLCPITYQIVVIIFLQIFSNSTVIYCLKIIWNKVSDISHEDSDNYVKM